MAFNPQDKPKGVGFKDVPLFEKALYGARLARVIELGQQEDIYGIKERVSLGFTIPSETIEIDGVQKQRMMWSYPMNKTSNPDSTLMKWIRAMNAEAAGWEEVIGKSCMLDIDVYQNQKKEDRNKILNVTAPMRGYVIDEPDCDVYIFDFENPDKDVWEKLSEFRQEQIKQAVNFEGSAVEAMLSGAPAPKQAEPDDDDIPF